jgi:hypothetical protein
VSGKTIVATLGVLASIATILGFVFTVAQGTNSTTSNPVLLLPSSSPIVTAPPPDTAYPSGTAYPPSAEQNFLATCQSYTGLPISHCQCDLSWVEANYPYSTSSPAMELILVEQAENNALCP